MATTSGPARRNDRSPASEVDGPVGVCGRRGGSTLGILFVGAFVLACGAQTLSPYPSVDLAPDREALLLTSADQSSPSRFTVQHLPIESTIAPGLYFHPQRFDVVRVSPNRQYAAFSTAGHHTLVGLLNLTTVVAQELDVLTEGDVLAFHWSVDSRILAYDYLPASGYRRVKAYDVHSGQRLVVPQIETRSTVHITFEKWGSQPHEVILSVTDTRSNTHQTKTIELIPYK